MKKNKKKIYLKIGILLFGTLMFLNSCYQEEEIIDDKKESKFFKLLTTVSYSKVKDKKIVARNTRKRLKLNINKSSNNNFMIDTTEVQILQSDYYTNYTFKVIMNETDSIYLNNYVLTIFNDSIYHQMLIKYPVIQNNDEVSYDTANAIATEIEGDMLVNKSFCNGYETDEWVETEIEHNCTAGGNHAPGETCKGKPWQQPWTETVGSWVTTCHPFISAGASSSGGGTTNGGSTPNDQTAPSPIGDDGNLIIGTTPFKDDNMDEIRREKECLKIKKIIEDYPLFMDKVRDLKNKDSLSYETSVAVFDDNSIGEYQGVSNNSTVQTLPTSPTSDYVSMAHVHNENNSIKSYSVPSLGDLQWIARRYKDGYLNASEFTAFLATADGTYFALTINNPTKLWKFFRYMDAGNPNITVEKRLEVAQYLGEIYKPILKKYYYDEQSALIKENAQGVPNNAQQLIYFMRFLKEADAGITVFESDENFSTFTKLSINGFNIDKSATPCEL